VGANLLDLLFIVDGSHRAFDQRDVHFFRKLLGVDDGAVDHIDKLRQFEQTFVHVKKRHVTS